MLGPGGRLGRFIIRAEIGRGGMGTVTGRRVRDVEDWRRGRLIEIMEARRSLPERLGRAEEARLARIEIERLGGASRARDADGD